MNHIQSPATGDDAIEREIKDKGLTAPRVTPSDIEANIHSEYYFTAAEGMDGAVLAMTRASSPGDTLTIQPLTSDYPKAGTVMGVLGLMTFCVLILRNGFLVTGESACASPENFDAEIGRKIARANAVNKIWPLMGYALKDQLAAAQPDHHPV